MLVGKNSEHVTNNPIMVDKWTIDYPEDFEVHKNVNSKENETEISKRYDGEVEMKNTEKQKYLGFILPNKGDNMQNINELKNKSVWIIKKKLLSSKSSILNVGSSFLILYYVVVSYMHQKHIIL